MSRDRTLARRTAATPAPRAFTVGETVFVQPPPAPARSHPNMPRPRPSAPSPTCPSPAYTPCLYPLRHHPPSRPHSFANVAGPFSVWFEEPGQNGAANFLTGAGGYCQLLTYGVPRLRINDPALTMSAPLLPQGAGRMRLRGLAYAGNRLDIAFDGQTLSVGVMAQASTAVEPTHTYAAPPVGGARADRGPSARSRSLSLLPARPLSERSQSGQVVMHGAALAALPLTLVDAAGARHALGVGLPPVVLPLQGVAIVPAAAATRG